MRHLLLTGFMGTGKSSLARLLAARYGLRCLDTDEEIESRSGRSIPDLFMEGEDLFRALETEALRTALGGEPAVIATGGGALMLERNRSLVGPQDTVVALTCSLPDLLPRLGDRKLRPLVADRTDAQIEELMQARGQFYDLYQQVDTSGRSQDEVAERIADIAHLDEADTLRFEQDMTSQVHVGRGLHARFGEYLDAGAAHVLLIQDETLERLGIAASVAEAIEVGGARCISACIPAGESQKTLDTVYRIYDRCLDARLERGAVVVGLGGGVVCDIAGFVAATYLRGVRLVLAPTTLLAQVDAAIGGKTGVDFRGVKNMVGSFYPARHVVIDPELLTTLPRTALSDGLAEVVKIAMVRSASLFEMTDSLSDPRDVLERVDIIRRAALEKVRLVQVDPYERGDRALLNFGHTVGHGLETASEYALSHGQAISVGTVAETWLADQLGLCDSALLARLRDALHRLQLPTTAPGLDRGSVYEAMTQDKKRSGGRLRFALPTALGCGKVIEVEESDARAAIDYATRSAA